MFGNVYPTIEQCLRTWVLPKSMTTPLASLFSKKRQVANAKANTFKCTASEAIGLLGVFGYFLMQIVIPNAEQSTKDKCQVFFALADIIDLIQLVPKGKITPAMVDRAVTTFLSLCISMWFQREYAYQISLVSSLWHSTPKTWSTSQLFCPRKKT